MEDILRALKVPGTITKIVRNEHRTNQQMIAAGVFALIKQWAEDYKSGNYDLRNEETCRVAFNMVDKVNRHGDEEVRRLLDSERLSFI